MNGPDPLKKLPNGHFHFLTLVRFMFRAPVVQEIEGGGQFYAQGASVSFRVTATSLAQAASMLESFLASRPPDEDMLNSAAYPASFEFEVCDPNSICLDFHQPGVVSESPWFYFDETDDSDEGEP